MTEFSTRKPVTLASPAETLVLASELANHARATGDAVLMLEAARALRGVPRALFAPGMTTPAMLFAEARILASDDPDMLAEIDWVQNDTPRTMRIVGGDYVARRWAVRHEGEGRALKPVVSSLPPLRNAGAVWGMSFPGKAA
jgi:hypothetical protein